MTSNNCLNTSGRIVLPQRDMWFGRFMIEPRCCVPTPGWDGPGRVEGTRELPVPPLPFIVVYRVLEGADVVEIVNVVHGAQRWPPAN